MRSIALASEFAYGNTRLRARFGRFLAAPEYEALLERDLDGLLGALADTDYAPEVEEASALGTGAGHVREVVRNHLGRALEAMRELYGGRARELVDLLTSRWDLHNLLALVRGRALDHPADRALANYVPAGRIGREEAEELARQPELAATVGLAVSWRLPDSPTAAALHRAWQAYERDEDLAELEHALAARHFERLASELEARAAAALRRAVRGQIDSANVLAALRLSEARRAEEIEGGLAARQGPFLPGGSIPTRVLHEAAQGETRKHTARALQPRLVEAWRGPLGRWAQDGDTVAAQRELETARIREATARYRHDPLGVAVPVAYATACEVEARNLRLIAEGAARGSDPAAVRERLVVA